MAEQLLELLGEMQHVEEGAVGLEVDQQVDVAVLAGVTTGCHAAAIPIGRTSGTTKIASGRRIDDDVLVMDRTAGMGRYAHREREQRWRLKVVPEEAERTAEIHDWYIVGTRLRLRRIDGGRSPAFKLAQKVRSDPADPETVSLTNMYLDPGEFEVLRRLPGREIHKTRWHLTSSGRRLSVDEFHGPLRGLVLAETELEPGERRRDSPSSAIEDVTNDDRFSGGSLAFASADDLQALQCLLDLG